MPERVGRWPCTARSVWQANGTPGRTEGRLHIFDQERLSPQRHENVIFARGIRAPQLQIALEPGAGGVMQWHKAALAEF
jgi:hypothetical protein